MCKCGCTITIKLCCLMPMAFLFALEDSSLGSRINYLVCSLSAALKVGSAERSEQRDGNPGLIAGSYSFIIRTAVRIAVRICSMVHIYEEAPEGICSSFEPQVRIPAHGLILCPFLKVPIPKQYLGAVCGHDDPLCLFSFRLCPVMVFIFGRILSASLVHLCLFRRHHPHFLLPLP